MMSTIARMWLLFRMSVVQWLEDQGPRRAAALAFYAGFSLAPLLLIAIAGGSLVFSADAVKGHVVEQLRGLLGFDAARAIKTVLKNSRMTGPSLLATVFGLATLIVGASGVFGDLQDSLNAIWKVSKRADRGWRGVVRDRLLSFSLVLGTGFLLLVSLLVSALLEALMTSFEGWSHYPTAVRVIGVGVSFGVVSTLFALMFRVLPDAVTPWRDVWLGASTTAVLFTIGKWLIGIYLGHSALASSYGAAGSFVVLLLWLYYSCQVFLMGAEFTHSFAHIFGRPPVPKRDAVSLERSESPAGLGVREGRRSDPEAKDGPRGG